MYLKCAMPYQTKKCGMPCIDTPIHCTVPQPLGVDLFGSEQNCLISIIYNHMASHISLYIEIYATYSTYIKICMIYRSMHGTTKNNHHMDGRNRLRINLKHVKS